MPYHGKDIRSSVKFRSHKTGRYVINHSGKLEGSLGEPVDLHAWLTDHSPAVSLISVQTKIMRASGLFPGGFVLVNQAKKPKNGSIVLIRYNGQTVIRRLVKKENNWIFVADDPREPDLRIDENTQIENLGVVIASIIRFEL